MQEDVDPAGTGKVDLQEQGPMTQGNGRDGCQVGQEQEQGHAHAPECVQPDARQGLGGAPWKARKEAKLIARALREKWPIRDDVREALPDMLADVVMDTGACIRDRIYSARTLLMADAINLRDEARGDVRVTGVVQIGADEVQAFLQGQIKALQAS